MENITHCEDCTHCFKCSRSKTGYSCEVWGYDDFACDVPLDGYCHKVKPKNRFPNISMTPEEFKQKMADAYRQHYEIDDDEEVVHITMDCIMCDLLRSLGYGEGIDIFNNTPMWYA